MEADRLRQVLTSLSATLIDLQRQIDEVNQILEAVSLTPTVFTSPPHSIRSPPALSSRDLERHIEELETDNRKLTENLEQLLARHGVCEAETSNAVKAREGMMRKYRLLVRVAADLLQKLMEGFPEEEFGDEMVSGLLADLRRRIRSPSTSTSSSNGTARPRQRHSPRFPRTPVASPGGHGMQTGSGGLSTEPSHASSTDSQLSALTESPTGLDGTVSNWAIHWGSKCPASIRFVAGPFMQKDFIKIGIDKTLLDDLFLGLTYSTDVGIRLATLPSSPPGLPRVKLVFLYDPFYLESGTGTYVFDWVTPAGNEDIINWLGGSDNGEISIFHTFTFSKKKKCWYYFGAVRWSLAWNNIWPTLELEAREEILQCLSDRSGGLVAPEEIEMRMEGGELQELSIEISQVGEGTSMQEIAARMGKSPREVRLRRPLVVGREQ